MFSLKTLEMKRRVKAQFHHGGWGPEKAAFQIRIWSLGNQQKESGAVSTRLFLVHAVRRQGAGLWPTASALGAKSSRPPPTQTQYLALDS